VNISAKIAESSIGAAALLQVASVAPNIAWGVSPTNCYVAEDIVRSPIMLERGRVTVPAGAGLGIEVDAAAVNRFRLR
jgi:L-alanine-DL-glutamate epimerase-like enolase superfamily enzyme